jgi:hypothetical protein
MPKQLANLLRENKLWPLDGLAPCRSRGARASGFTVAWDGQKSAEIAGAFLDSHADDLTARIDAAYIERKQRGVSRK